MESQQPVDIDVPCVQCGYNLRMQPRDGLCSECATPVRVTLEESPYAWETWGVESLASAIGFLLVAQSVGLGAIGFTLFAAVIVHGQEEGLIVFFGMIQLVAAIFLPLAAWRMPALRLSARREGHTLRRVLSIAGIVSWLLTLILMGRLQSSFDESYARAMSFFGGVSLFVWGRYLWSLAWPLSVISRRCDWRTLGRTLRSMLSSQALVLSLWGAFLLLLMVGDKLDALIEDAMGPAIFVILTIISFGLLAAALAIPVTQIVLIIALARLWVKLRAIATIRHAGPSTEGSRVGLP